MNNDTWNTRRRGTLLQRSTLQLGISVNKALYFKTIPNEHFEKWIEFYEFYVLTPITMITAYAYIHKLQNEKLIIVIRL